ncbi:MAG: glycogen debranching protein, partial [Marinirhabdus sp.]
NSPSIEGKTEYLNSPYVTAGDRVYMVGHQDGSFPPLGWHITGEMGGIWDHPIKLMDGFDAALIFENGTLKLDKASKFINYPYASQHLFQLKKRGLTIERWQFVPDGKEGLAVQYILKNEGAAKNFQFKFTGRTDLRPTWLGERTQMLDAKDSAYFLNRHNAWAAKDSKNNWFTIFGPGNGTKIRSATTHNNGTNGVSNSLYLNIKIAEGGSKTLTFVIAGSYRSENEAVKTYNEIKANIKKLAIEKRERYKALAEKSKLTIPDKKIEQAFEWLKYNSDWLVRTVPEIGSGIGAGLPDYPWWFGADSEYALQGYMAIGQTGPVYSTIKLLDSISEKVNGNGRIVHEMSSNGAVFNPGNINETPQFASLVWQVYRWNGDAAFLKKYFPTVQKGLQWLSTEKDSDKNGFPNGFGMMEVHGLDSEMIDVAAYTQKAYADASKMAAALGKDEIAETYAKKAKTLKHVINERFWSEDFQSYGDFLGTGAQALRLIGNAITRADTLKKPWSVSELKSLRAAILKNPSPQVRPFVLHHNWVVNTPMEVGLATPKKAKKALKTASKYTNPFGV